MTIHSDSPLLSSRIPSHLVVAALALAMALPCSRAFAASHGSGSGSGGHGRLIPLLPNGTPIEPSTYREESTESAEILDEGRWDWSVDLVGGAMDRIDRLNSSTVEWAHAEVRRGVGRGLEVGAAAESWNRGLVHQGALAQSVQESGYGPTTLSVRERLSAAGSPGLAASAGVRVRLPGSLDGPGAHVAEGGVFLPVTFPLGESTHLGTTLEGNVVPDALDSGRHFEGVSSMELSHDFADHFSGRVEAVGVWYGEAGRPALGVVDTGFSVDPAPHVGITLGGSAGLSGGTTELGWFGRLSVHP